LRVIALIYLTALLIIPLGVLVHDGLRSGLVGLWQAITLPIVWHALLLTLWTAALTAIINAVMGTLTAYVLTRFDFAGKGLLNAIVELPLALPTLITGLMLVILFGPQTPIGAWLASAIHLHIIFAPPGIVLALLFVTFPFVVRAVQPALTTMDREPEAAAATLGANSWTIFFRVTLPAITFPLISGTLLAFARATGEFGAIVLVAGNIPFHTQTVAIYVQGEIESQNQLGASAVSVALLAIALAVIVLVDVLQHRRQSREAHQ